jgi:hypothetical protein
MFFRVLLGIHQCIPIHHIELNMGYTQIGPCLEIAVEQLYVIALEKPG